MRGSGSSVQRMVIGAPQCGHRNEGVEGVLGSVEAAAGVASVPLWRSTVTEIRAWLKRNPQLGSTSALLPNREGTPMTRSNVTQRLALAVRAATKHHPDLAHKRISPHTIRHSTAMHLLQSGVDVSVIALWLGHESPITTHHYVEADLAMKDKALARLKEPKTRMRRYRAPDTLLHFLDTL